LGIFAHVIPNVVFRWPFDFFLHDISINLIVIGSRESNTANEHLEADAGNSPDIDGWGMLVLMDDFRGKIVRSSYKGIHYLFFNIRVVILIHVFSLTEVNKLDIVIIVDHNVQRFEVTMHDSLALKVFKAIDHLGHINPR